MEDLESGNLKYEAAEKFLVEVRKEFEKEDKKAVKVVELKRLE